MTLRCRLRQDMMKFKSKSFRSLLMVSFLVTTLTFNTISSTGIGICESFNKCYDINPPPPPPPPDITGSVSFVGLTDANGGTIQKGEQIKITMDVTNTGSDGGEISFVPYITSYRVGYTTYSFKYKDMNSIRLTSISVSLSAGQSKRISKTIDPIFKIGDWYALSIGKYYIDEVRWYASQNSGVDSLYNGNGYVNNKFDIEPANKKVIFMVLAYDDGWAGTTYNTGQTPINNAFSRNTNSLLAGSNFNTYFNLDLRILQLPGFDPKSSADATLNYLEGDWSTNMLGFDWETQHPTTGYGDYANHGFDILSGVFHFSNIPSISDLPWDQATGLARGNTFVSSDQEDDFLDTDHDGQTTDDGYRGAEKTFIHEWLHTWGVEHRVDMLYYIMSAPADGKGFNAQEKAKIAVDWYFHPTSMLELDGALDDNLHSTTNQSIYMH